MSAESLRVLIVCDDLNDVSLLRQCLAGGPGHPYNFTVVRTAEKGIEACLAPGARRPDCVIIDLHLPDMNGVEAIKRLQERDGELGLPVVLFIDTGEDCKAATAALRAGAQDYIARSWLTPEGLACAVENAVARFKTQERLRGKRAALERQGREFRELIENVPDVITRFDRDFRHIYISPVIECFTGLPPAAFAGKTSREAGLPAAVCDVWEAALREVTATGRGAEFEFDLDGPAGHRRFRARLVPQLSASEEVEGVLAVSTDVTDVTRAERHLREVIDRLAVFVAVTSPDGVLLEANRPALEDTPDDPSGALGRPLEDTSWWARTPEARADLRRAIACAARGEDVRYDAPLRAPDGSLRTVDLRIAPLIDAAGRVTHLIASGVDITERTRAEEEARRAAARERARAGELKAVLRAAPAAIWITQDRDCHVMTGNPASYRLLGLPERSNVSAAAWADDPGGRPYWEYRGGAPLPPEDLPMHIAASRGVETEGAELTLRFKDGSEKHIYGNAMPLRDQAGEVYGAISAFIDITKLKQAEEALRLSERRFRRFTNSDIIGMAFGNLGGRLYGVNDEFLRIIGWTRQEFETAPANWTGLTPPDWTPADEAGAAEARTRGACRPYEKEFERRDGSRTPVLVGYTLLDDSGDDLLAFILDLTERKRWERAIRDAERRKDEFLAMLAHELRNPLAAVRTALHILLLPGAGEAELSWSREVIDRQVKHLTRLIDDLLDVSRISAGKIQLKPVAVDVREVVNRASESVWPLMTRKGHNLSVDLPQRPLATVGDPVRLEQVVGNLLTNAAKYTDNGGAIALTGGIEGGSVVLRLRDNGVGIAADLLPHVFDLYTQADGNTTRSQGGLGIGLTLVKKLVEMHGGSVSAWSDGPGLGSEFTVRLPASDPDPVAEETDHATHDAAPSADGARSRVLVVDDNEDMALGLSILIESVGYQVRTAHDGESALDVARSFRPRIVILDIGLPGMNGFELARSFREDPSLCPAALVGVSGYGQKEDRERARDAGFDHYILKPVDVEILFPILARAAAEDDARTSS
ncbi:MAG: PAS domain S-box protein [Isosphaeraceae bacterium]